MSRQATCCVLLLLAAALPCAASSDKPAPPPKPQAYNKPPDGYHDVKVGDSVVRVKDSVAPHMNGGSDSDDGSYDPQKLDFTRTSTFSNKSFETGSASLTKSFLTDDSHHSGIDTHSFATAHYNQSDRKFSTAAYNESSRTGDNFSKTYALPTTSSTGADKAFPLKTSEFQGKSALAAQGPSKVDPFATPSSLSEKTFFDPQMLHVKHDKYATGLDVKRLADLPNRTLTFDEVRNLINHDQSPNLNERPADPSPALNDPGWKPEAEAPLHDGQSPHWAIHATSIESTPVAPPADMDGPNDLPAPGEMAQPPENSEPLPK